MIPASHTLSCLAVPRAAPFCVARNMRPGRRACRLVRRVSFLLFVIVPQLHAATPDTQPARLERSFWIHASLGLKPHRGYWGPTLPPTTPPTEQEVANAAGLLTGRYAANRLYLVYHQEIPLDDARRVLSWWRRHCPAEVEIVPAFVLRMYDKAQTPVFSIDNLRALCAFCRDELKADHCAVFDVYPDRDQGQSLTVLEGAFSRRVIRIGIQPDERLGRLFAGAVQDTWSGFCYGKTNADWLAPGFGADTLRNWVQARNASAWRTAWDLIVVAWDYNATARGEYPGYDDAKKNMPLPAGRNALAAREILKLARPDRMAGFSSDLTILQANSISQAHDGPRNSFYEVLKRGEPYGGYYALPLDEIVAIYHALRDGKPIPLPATMPASTRTSP